MKPHEDLFFLRHIAMGRGGMEKVVHYLDDHLPDMFSHPLKTMEDCDCCHFYVEFSKYIWSFGAPVIL